MNPNSALIHPAVSSSVPLASGPTSFLLHPSPRLIVSKTFVLKFQQQASCQKVHHRETDCNVLYVHWCAVAVFYSSCPCCYKVYSHLLSPRIPFSCVTEGAASPTGEIMETLVTTSSEYTTSSDYSDRDPSNQLPFVPLTGAIRQKLIDVWDSPFPSNCIGSGASSSREGDFAADFATLVFAALLLVPVPSPLLSSQPFAALLLLFQLPPKVPSHELIHHRHTFSLSPCDTYQHHLPLVVPVSRGINFLRGSDIQIKFDSTSISCSICIWFFC